jgi:hypothetical protein
MCCMHHAGSCDTFSHLNTFVSTAFCMGAAVLHQTCDSFEVACGVTLAVFCQCCGRTAVGT